jgi:hypothetical protein
MAQTVDGREEWKPWFDSNRILAIAAAESMVG